MDLSEFRKRRNKSWQKILPLALGLILFLTDHPNFSSTTIFEAPVSSSTKKKYRLPSSISSQVIRFDCSNPQSTLEVSTSLETIRVEAINCSDKMNMKNLNFNTSLNTFPTKLKTFSSEFAYLAKGDNNFQLTIGNKVISLNIHRFD